MHVASPFQRHCLRLKGHHGLTVTVAEKRKNDLNLRSRRSTLFLIDRYQHERRAIHSWWSGDLQSLLSFPHSQTKLNPHLRCLKNSRNRTTFSDLSLLGSMFSGCLSFTLKLLSVSVGLVKTNGRGISEIAVDSEMVSMACAITITYIYAVLLCSQCSNYFIWITTGL